jgi:phage baseplate assembly protein W
MTYYTFPLKIDQLLIGKALPQIDVRPAINENIQLILRSFALSYRFDPAFGCVVHKYQAATPPQRRAERSWRDEMRENIQANLKDMLTRYETRIKVEDVLVQLKDPNVRHGESTVRVKVEITGQLTLGRKEKFYWPDSEVSEDAAEVLPLVIPVGSR